MDNANITATPVGHIDDIANLEESIVKDYETNRNDNWGVEVYFRLTKNIE